MVSREYRVYLKSPEWAEKRNQVINDRGGKCQKCNGKGNHVHHITYRNLFNEPLEDLMLLCKRCHEKQHEIISSHYKNRVKTKKKNKKRLRKMRNKRGAWVKVKA